MYTQLVILIYLIVFECGTLYIRPIDNKTAIQDRPKQKGFTAAKVCDFKRDKSDADLKLN